VKNTNREIREFRAAFVIAGSSANQDTIVVAVDRSAIRGPAGRP
jgi:hypothetical protein